VKNEIRIEKYGVYFISMTSQSKRGDVNGEQRILHDRAFHKYTVHQTLLADSSLGSY